MFNSLPKPTYAWVVNIYLMWLLLIVIYNDPFISIMNNWNASVTTHVSYRRENVVDHGCIAVRLAQTFNIQSVLP